MSIPLEAVVGELHIVEGTRQSVTRPTAALVAPRRAARGRAGDMLFVLAELRGPASLPYEALIDRIEAIYWDTPGTVTSALRAALVAANNWLMDRNVPVPVADRLRAGVSCAVLRGVEVFIAQAGPSAAYVAHHGQVERFPARGVVAPAMGASRGVEVRFSHATLSPGDTLLLCDSVTAEHTPDEAIASAIVYTDVEVALQNLEKLADSGDLTALIVEGAAEAKAKAAITAAVERAAPATLVHPSLAQPPVEQATPEPTFPLRVEPEAGPAVETEVEPWIEEGEGAERIAWTQRLRDSVARLNLGTRLVAIGGSLAAGLTLAGQGIATILQRMLPEGAIAAQPSKKGANTLLMGIALLIPLAVLTLVVTTYTQYSTLARFQTLIAGARNDATQAAARQDPTARRAQWASAFDQATSALEIQPESAEALKIRDEAQRALDQLDHVVRLPMSLLWDFKSPGPRRVALQVSQTPALFILDRAAGRVFQLTLNEAGDGVLERGDPPVRAASKLSVSDRLVGDLIDLVWMPAGGVRTRSSLLILDSGGLLDYDPTWYDAARNSGRLSSVPIGPGPVPQGVRAIAAFGGNLYVLDGGANQIWRYDPQGDGYTKISEGGWFKKPPGDLSNVTDMAIDGSVYLLHADGRIRKFFAGEEKAFAVSGMSEKFKRPVALAVDAEAQRSALYIADAGSGCVVQLAPEGAFVRRICTTGDAFNSLEDVLVDERSGRLFVTSGGKLYTARLPAKP